ncbi:DUF551 domain-containing protein [Escherichia coli]|nr:DUF551 domain-containing protein [Escherichia coli]EFI5980702.1 DUF551 domain-containing protein [Escherichia coli]EKD0000197.1 DUF551 domain-containing protein [Escherichia coli]
MTTFTDEDKELIKEIRERIGSLDVRDNIERRAYEIALASLEAEAVCVIDQSNLDYLEAGYDADVWPVSRAEMADVFLYRAVPPVPDKIALAIENLKQKLVECNRYNYCADAVKGVEDACHAAMLLRQREGNPHVTPDRLPSGFTIEDAKALHEDLVRSHISQALSGEKMKKKDRDADLRWIHGVIVQAAWFVKASLEQNALSGTPPVTTDGWISCSERMPDDGQWCVVNTEYGYYVQCWSEGQGWLGDYISIPECDVINWMQLPEPPQEVRQ